MIATDCPGQSWSLPFDHETIISSGPMVATDHLLPFGGYQNGNISYWTYPPFHFEWPDRMNAVHMALIPKGPNQGKVLVWGETNDVPGSAVLIRAPGSGPALQANEYWACTAWSIIDPAPVPVGPRFQNFLLPIDKWTAPPGSSFPQYRWPTLFCAGHVWSPYGDLVVAPSYLGKPHLRPQNVAFSSSVTYSAQFTAYELGYDQECELTCNPLPLGVALDKAVLMAPGACTHHSDMHQRYIEMETTQKDPNRIFIQTPLDDKRAPRGIYMLFLRTDAGSIANAIWVRLQ